MAVLLPPPDAARVIVELWEAGEAVVPLDPAAPARRPRRSLAALRPTALIDRDGRHRRPDGMPAAAGVAAVVATSGTTGEPQGRRAHLRRAGGLRDGRGRGPRPVMPEDGWLCCLPLHLVAGLAVVGRAWTTGAPVTVQPGFDLGRRGRAAARRNDRRTRRSCRSFRRCCAGCSTPTRRAQPGSLTSSWAAGRSIPALLARARAAGATVSTTYGMTETWGGIVHNGHPLLGGRAAARPGGGRRRRRWDGWGRRDPGAGTDAHAGLPALAGGDGGRHRPRRLVPHRRPRPVRPRGRRPPLGRRPGGRRREHAAASR